jgi:hypothetical protein
MPLDKIPNATPTMPPRYPNTRAGAILLSAFPNTPALIATSYRTNYYPS